MEQSHRGSSIECAPPVFQFSLLPMDEIAPWGAPGNRSLSWFALTDGYYQLRLGDERVYAHDLEACASLGWDRPQRAPEGFEGAVGYQVARLFLDFAHALPSILSPVPFDVARELDSADSQLTWESRVHELDWDSTTLGPGEASPNWVDDRTIDGSHLRAGPSVTCWRVGDTIHVRCDNRQRKVDGVLIWASGLVEAQVPVDRLLTELRRFGSDLLAQMDERIASIEAGWTREDVRLDPVSLREQHRGNEELWAAAIDAPPRELNWERVRRLSAS